MACNDKEKFKTAEASTKASLRTKGAIDQFLNIKDTALFRKLNKAWSEVARNKFGVEGNLFYEENDKAIPNRIAFKSIDRAKGINYSLPGVTVSSEASPKTIAFVKDFLKQIGVSYQSVENIVVNGIKQDANGVANTIQSIVQVVQGKEASALPEEAMHFAVEIIQQTNPELFNRLLKEINNYNLYKQVLADYSTNLYYQNSDGKPDILKLKKEAIAKVLTEVIISQNEERSDNNEKLAKVENWWDQILNWLKGLVIKSGFDQAAMDILSGNDIGTVDDINKGQIFFQQSEQQRVFDKIKEQQTKIEKKEDGYYLNGQKIRRVTDLVNAWYENRFRSNQLSKSEYQEAVDTLKADKGTDGHSDLEYAFSIYVDENGYLREEPLEDKEYVSRLVPDDRTMYEMLRDNLQERLVSFPEGTRFMSEAIIFDEKRKLAGTVDFLAVEPSGKTHILDWKFTDLNTDKFKDIPWYKVAAWNLQMGHYKSIINASANVNPSDFGQTRMIPIQAIYSKGNPKENVLPKLMRVRIGDVNVKNIDDDFLLPVGIQEEKTGNKKIDKLLEKLNSVYRKLSEEKVLPGEKENKAEQLNALYKAIRLLQVKQDIRPLLNQVKTLNKQIEFLVNKYDNDFRDTPKEEIPKDKISAFAGLLRINLESLQPYLDIDKQLRFLFQEDNMSQEDKELYDDLKRTVDKAEDYMDTLTDLDEEFGKKFNDADYNPEKIVKGVGKYFLSTATLQIRNIQALFKKANRALALSGMETFTEVKKLEALKKDYQAWATRKGLTIRNQFDILMKKEQNELIDEFDPKFYSELRKKVEEKDFNWITENVDQDAFKQHMTEKLEKEIQRAVQKPRVGTEEQNGYELKRDIEKIKELFNIVSNNSIGWLNYNEIKKFPVRSKWESKEWKELSRPENKAAKDFYNYIIERNAYYRDIGYINAQQARVFLPWIRKGLMETIVFGGKSSVGEQFLRNISVDENDTGLGQIDPITNEPINTVPIYFTTKIDEGKYSTDLFRTMSLYNEFAIKFKNLSAIEEESLQLLRAERNKKSISTSQFGKTQREEDGSLKFNNDNIENSKLLQDMIKGIVYQQKFIESETFDQMLIKFGTFGEKINKKLGMEVFPEKLDGRQMSLNKSINQLNNVFQLNTLGLNVLSATSNSLGGRFQSIINAGKYFTKTDFIKYQTWLLSNKMAGGVERQKALAALDFFIPFTDNYNRTASRNLSLNKVNDEAIQDFLMFLMRNGDEAVQAINFYSYINNSIVIDDKIVNTREYLKGTDEYKNFYQGTSTERKQRADKFEEDVKKLNDEKGVLKLSTVKDGKLIIPGIDQTSDSVIELRRKVQQINSDALGNLSEENRRLINMNVYGSSMMVFKNWIPRLVDVRIGNLKYNAGSDAYEWGRSRMIYRIMSEDLLGSIGKLKNALVGNDKGIEFVRELYEQKKADYEQDTGKEFNITEDEFIDLVRQNIKNQAVDLVFYATLMSIVALISANPPEEEDEIVKNQYKLLAKASDKLADEIGYFYDPSSPMGLISKGIFPSLSLLDNYAKVIKNFMVENYAIVVGDEELEEKNKVTKYVLKSFPLASQGAALLPMFYPELAKDLGIKMQSQYNMK